MILPEGNPWLLWPFWLQNGPKYELYLDISEHLIAHCVLQTTLNSPYKDGKDQFCPFQEYSGGARTIRSCEGTPQLPWSFWILNGPKQESIYVTESHCSFDV